MEFCKKSNSFLLLEIVLCITLFTSALLPLLNFPLRILKKQEQALLQIELARAAKLELAELLSRIYSSEFDSTTLTRNDPSIPAKKIEIHALRHKNIPFQCQFICRAVEDKMTKEEKRAYLSELSLHLHSTQSKESYTLKTLLCLIKPN